MAKTTTIFLASAVCFLAFIGSAYSVDQFIVQGEVYCDTCRFQYMTGLSEIMPDATVRVECKESEGGKVTFSKLAKTNSTGWYSLEVDGDHEEEICEVKLVKSSREDCSEIDAESHIEQAAIVSLTNNNGILTPYRSANPLGFLKKDVLPGCRALLEQLAEEDGETLTPELEASLTKMN